MSKAAEKANADVEKAKRKADLLGRRDAAFILIKKAGPLVKELAKKPDAEIETTAASIGNAVREYVETSRELNTLKPGAQKAE